MYAETQEELNDKYQALKDHPVMEKYSNAQDHIDRYMLRQRFSNYFALRPQNEHVLNSRPHGRFSRPHGTLILEKFEKNVLNFLKH